MVVQLTFEISFADVNRLTADSVLILDNILIGVWKMDLCGKLVRAQHILHVRWHDLLADDAKVHGVGIKQRSEGSALLCRLLCHAKAVEHAGIYARLFLGTTFGHA